jgi:antitoxin ChpS
LASAKLSSKYQITIPKKVVDALGLESGDRLLLEVEGDRIVLTPPSKVANPTVELYGSVKSNLDAVKAIRQFRKAGGRT